jgi:hypothetical protein
MKVKLLKETKEFNILNYKDDLMNYKLPDNVLDDDYKEPLNHKKGGIESAFKYIIQEHPKLQLTLTECDEIWGYLVKLLETNLRWTRMSQINFYQQFLKEIGKKLIFDTDNKIEVADLNKKFKNRGN